MKKFVNWIVYSSENPQNFSLTIKGAVATLLPVVIMLASQLGFTLDGINLEEYILSLITIATTIVTLIGLIRKMVNTFKGKEAVVFVKDAKTKKISTVAKKKK